MKIEIEKDNKPAVVITIDENGVTARSKLSKDETEFLLSEAAAFLVGSFSGPVSIQCDNEIEVRNYAVH